MKKDNDNRGFAAVCTEYIKKHWRVILLIVAGYIAVSALNFVNIATSQTIASFSLDDFEIGQIADRDIIAPRNISATFDNPIVIQKGERIIHKGFAIEQENYDKLRKLAESPAYFDYRKFLNNELFLLVLGVVWFLL
ncbi:MAG: phosphohydrolase, partial [Treponema socranskii subsp. buccale]